jgi:hypothetical protein
VRPKPLRGRKFNQRANWLQGNPNKTKEKLLGFPWIPLAESGLFNGLQPKKNKKPPKA